MIVRNEAHQLAECLQPLAHLFNELVIVDTGSRDQTREIARRFTQQVFEFPWCDDFSAARNESLRHATSDWVFWLDADDRFDDVNVARLHSLFTALRDQSALSEQPALPDQPAAFMCDTICLPRDAHDLERVISHPRLLRRHPDLRFTGRVHEQILPSALALGYQVYASSLQIKHVGYCDAALLQRKLHRDIRLLTMDYALDPHHPATLLHLGTTYAQLGNFGEARRHLRQLLQAASQPADYLRRAHSVLAELCLRESQYAEALNSLTTAIHQFPDDDHLAYLLAEVLYELDQYPAAQQVLLHLIQRPGASPYCAGVPLHLKQLVAPRSLGEVLRIQRALPAAEEVLLSVVQKFPGDPLSWHALGRVYIDMARPDQLQHVREQLSALRGGEMFSTLLLAAWHMQQSQWKAAETAIDRLIASSPHVPIARLMRAEVLTRCGAALPARIQAYRDVLRVSPGNPQAAEMIKRLEGALHRPVTVAHQHSVATFSLGVGTPSS